MPRYRVLLLKLRVDWARKSQLMVEFLWGREAVMEGGRVFLGVWVGLEPFPLKGMNLMSGILRFLAIIFYSF